MRAIKKVLAASVAAAGLAATPSAQAGTDLYIGEIMEVGFTFCPRGTAALDGQLLAINSNTALFSLLGTTYGGDGRTTFALPDMRGRVAIHQGSAPGLSNRSLGERSGSEEVTMTVQQLPNHGHRAGIKTVTAPPDTNRPSGASFTVFPEGSNIYNRSATPGPLGNRPNFMNPESVYVEPTGGGQAVPNMQPFLVTRKCIALQGVYPSRN